MKIPNPKFVGTWDDLVKDSRSSDVKKMQLALVAVHESLSQLPQSLREPPMADVARERGKRLSAYQVTLGGSLQKAELFADDIFWTLAPDVRTLMYARARELADRMFRVHQRLMAHVRWSTSWWRRAIGSLLGKRMSIGELARIIANEHVDEAALFEPRSFEVGDYPALYDCVRDMIKRHEWALERERR